MIQRVREIRGFTGGKQIFCIDFQNDGEYIDGCIAGGRQYAHINPNGDVEPCVFIHYSGANIHDKSLLECLQQPLFKEYHKGQPFNGNHLRPCPMLENPQILGDMVRRSGAHSTDMQQPESPRMFSAAAVPTQPAGCPPLTACGPKSTPVTLTPKIRKALTAAPAAPHAPLIRNN